MDLTEKDLEALIIAADLGSRKEKIAIEPTQLLIKRSDVQKLADERGVSFTEMLDWIQDFVAKHQEKS